MGDQPFQQLFTFSPFGLGCRECPQNVTIQLKERCIRDHLKKHNMDSCVGTVRSLLDSFRAKLDSAKSVRTIEPYRADQKIYIGYSCLCGHTIQKRKDNAVRHCKKAGCDPSKLQTVDLMKLCCGRYVTHAQCDFLFINSPPRIKEQFDYVAARGILLPFLPLREKHDHTYTHMYTPLITACGCSPAGFHSKIKADYRSIHSPATESLLLKILDHAEIWLLKFAPKNVLMVPGQFRAGLQTFEGGEVDDVSQKTIYTMQHDPTNLLPELKKFLSFAYRRGLFRPRGFDSQDGFAVAHFLKDLLLEIPPSVAYLPFAVEFCLMFPFRVSDNDSVISMISCDTVSSLFSKILSVLKAAVCSVICSFSEQTFTSFAGALVKSVREAPVIHTMSPLIRQIREMHERLPKRQKTILDPQGNIIVDQYAFPYDDWSQIVPKTVFLMRETLRFLANGSWWEPVVDPATIIQVSVDADTADISLLGVIPVWNVGSCLALDQLDSFTALLQLAFHGFGGGSARMRELSDPTMFHCLYSNDTVYYSMSSLKGFKSSSRRRFKKVERKLPPVIARYFLLFRSLVHANISLFEEADTPLIFPRRREPSKVGVANMIRNIFNLDSSPDMRQVRQFWACVSNFVTGEDDAGKNFSTSTASLMAASKMGHSKMTHGLAYSSERLGGDEAHFNVYHFAIGDTSYEMSKLRSNTLSLGDIRTAMSIRYPNARSSDGHNYLSLQQKELVEFAYGHEFRGKPQHCLCLLAPGEGKSESYIIPTIARHLGNQKSQTIIHVSPYNFLARYQFKNATDALEKVGFGSSISTCMLTGRDITG